MIIRQWGPLLAMAIHRLSSLMQRQEITLAWPAEMQRKCSETFRMAREAGAPQRTKLPFQVHRADNSTPTAFPWHFSITSGFPIFSPPKPLKGKPHSPKDRGSLQI